MSAPLLEVDGLCKTFRVRDGRTVVERQALRDASFHLQPGETLGVVGESGSGKTTLARSIMRLLTPTAGEVRLQGTRIDGLSAKELRRTVRPRMRMIFQHPEAVLNPGYSVGHSIQVPMRLHGGDLPEAELSGRTADLLRSVGLTAEYAAKRPSELSGGERRRVMICRALATDPSVVLADEPMSGLDVLLQDRILRLLKAEQVARGFGMILISHDLERINQVCDRVLVMYRGRIVEDTRITGGGGAEAVDRYLHPYSRLLQRSRVALVQRDEGMDTPGGETRASGTVPEGGTWDRSCLFAGDCPLRATRDGEGRCTAASPVLQAVDDTGHRVACHYVEGRAESAELS